MIDVKNMAETFRVSLCLERYFSDERALVRLAVDERWERVEVLKEYLRAEFGLSEPFYLLSDGHLLPSTEPLRPLLRDGEVIDAIPSREDRRDHKLSADVTSDAADPQAALQMMKTEALSLLDAAEKHANGRRKRVRRRTLRKTASHSDEHPRFSESMTVVKNPRSGDGPRGRLVASLPVSCDTAAAVGGRTRVTDRRGSRECD